MERTMEKARPQDVQVSCPSVMFPSFATRETASARRAAPHPMHLSHSTDFKFIPARNSLTSIDSLPPESSGEWI
jgi:hypothetical protein